MIDVTTIILILWAHWIGDFILQSDYHAVNKSKDNLVLMDHVIMYSLPFFVVGMLVPLTFSWIVGNAVLHGLTDYVTSRMTTRYWLAEKRHEFFVTIGFDQSFHFTCLFLTYWSMIVLA